MPQFMAQNCYLNGKITKNTGCNSTYFSPQKSLHGNRLGERAGNLRAIS